MSCHRPVTILNSGSESPGEAVRMQIARLHLKILTQQVRVGPENLHV